MLKRAGVEGNPLSDETLRKFWIGEVLHRAIQDVMSADPEAGVVAHEVAVRDEEHAVSGRADTLTRTAEGQEVVEYKTIDSRAFHFGDLPYASHLHQAGTYLVFPTEHGYADRARIAYLGKGDGRTEEFTIERTPELVEFIKWDLRRLNDLYAAYRERGELPPALEAPKSDYRIRYCEYLKTGKCCGDEKGEAPAVPRVPAGDGDPGDERAVPALRQQGGEEGADRQEGQVGDEGQHTRVPDEGRRTADPRGSGRDRAQRSGHQGGNGALRAGGADGTTRSDPGNGS